MCTGEGMVEGGAHDDDLMNSKLLSCLYVFLDTIWVQDTWIVNGVVQVMRPLITLFCM